MTNSKDSNAPPSYDDAVGAAGPAGPAGRLPPGAVGHGPYNVVSTLPPALPPRTTSPEGPSNLANTSAPANYSPSQPGNTSPTNPSKPLLAPAQNRFPSYTSIPSPSFSTPTSPNSIPTYRYQNPLTGHVITTMLPPSHPAMQCLQEGRHQPGPTYFGLCGILTSILFFPIGLAMLLVDRRVVCDRCGEVMSEGC